MSLPEAVKGAPAWLPPRAQLFARVEEAFLEQARLAGYVRIRTPVFEHTEVFARGVGTSTDIVNKEMYTFADRSGRSLTLRPEGTAGIVRAALDAGVPKAGGLPAKYVWAGECFRYERPQAGRQRQFSQVDLEVLGSDDPFVDAEVVLLGFQMLRAAGLEQITLRMNTLGDPGDRPAYHERLNAYLDRFELPPDVAERRHANPLRAFDSKAPGMAEIMADAPLLADHVNAEAKAHHDDVCRLLEDEGLPLTHDARLVRGLDYYTRTTFEYQVGTLGAQNAVGGGGRYDGLAETLGYPERFPGIGLALGVDRTVLALEGSDDLTELPRVHVFVVATDESLAADAFALTVALRRAGIATDMGFDARRAKAQFKAADRAGARWAVVLGAEEAAAGKVGLKDLVTGDQAAVTRSELPQLLRRN